MFTWEELWDLERTITHKINSLEESKDVLKAYPNMVEMFDRDIAKFKELEKKLERARLEVLE
jgi:hypothetical protein